MSGGVGQPESMPLLIRNAEADMEDLLGIFRRASLSNENDRGLLQEHPEWLVLSAKACEKEGRGFRRRGIRRQFGPDEAPVQPNR